MRRTLTLLLFVVACLAPAAWAASPYKEAVTFTYTGDVGFGNSVFVVGNHPDVGNGDVTQAVKLRYTTGNVWTGQIAIQAGTELTYRFLSRSGTNANWCSASNFAYLTPEQFRSIPAQPAAPYQGKTIYYLSGWSAPSLFYNNNGTWTSAALARVGAGRTAGESLYKVGGIGQAGERLEFVFMDGAGHYDNPPGGGNYLTDLDVFQVQDGNVFSYQPPATVSAPQVLSQFINSTAPNIPGRDVRIYLPRGYTQNSTRRYPVIYFHDGQNVFDPGGSFGSWSADATATREIGQGRMREAVMVAINNTANRILEYMPPTDSYSGTQGRGDAYASFVINNVRPYIDSTYRTLNDPKNTIIVGSSLGGLISLYFAREFPTFGKAGVFSAAWWIAPNYVAQVNAGTKKPLRVYTDFGTAEPASDFNNALDMYDTHLAQSYATNGDVLFVAGCGQQHNEAAWAARLPRALQYLLPAREDPAELTQREFPPFFRITSVQPTADSAAFQFTGLFGFSYKLLRSVNFVDWQTVTTSPPVTKPWAEALMTDPNLPGGGRGFWKLQATPAP